jgi:hypothetical protein
MTRRDAVLLLALSCACAGEPRRAEGPPTSSGHTRARAILPDLTPGPALETTARASDPLWQRAERRDPIDLVRLADREGAAGLLEGVELGRSIGLTALAALPHAEDAELALDRLCELATRLDAAGRSAVLLAIHGIVTALAPDRERLAGEALAGCSRKLGRLAADPGVPAADRDLAQSSQSSLEPYLAPTPPP